MQPASGTSIGDNLIVHVLVLKKAVQPLGTTIHETAKAIKT